MNFADFLILSVNFGQVGDWRQGDFDGVSTGLQDVRDDFSDVEFVVDDQDPVAVLTRPPQRLPLHHRCNG